MTIPIPATAGPIERAIAASAVAELLAAELWRRTGAMTVAELGAEPGSAA